MNTVTIETSGTYDVIIGNKLHKDLGAYAERLHLSGKAVIISDTNVWPLYGDAVSTGLVSFGFSVFSYMIPAGEESKNSSTYFNILNYLAEKQISRTDVLIALGGGVVGDLAGFAAATYLRGISYIQLPTSLLAMVDSSVGGKTGINLPAGKNLAGAFYPPRLVLCDVNALDTLPENVFRDGCAEVIKYAVLFDPELFEHLITKGAEFDREYVITRCIELKRNVVIEDERDNGSRKMLNLGHTIGHSIERASNYSVSHGQSVAIGTAMITKAAVKANICNQQDCKKILNLLNLFGLPTHTDVDAETLVKFALSDKKRSGNKVDLILPKCIGQCVMQSTPIDELMAIIEAGF